MASQPFDKRQRKVNVLPDERKKMGKEMKKKLLHWTETRFVNETLKERPVAQNIWEALQKQFPNLEQEELEVQACKIAMGKENVWKKIVWELNQKNENKKPGVAFQRYRFAPSSHLELDDEHAIHKYIAGYQFYKMMTRWSEEETLSV